MSSPPGFTIAICGAGLGDLGLALALQSHSIPCTIYEARSTPKQAIRGSLQLASNGQAALAGYTILPQLSAESCFYKHVTVRDKHSNTIRKISLGGKEDFGYDSMRIVRATLAQELEKAVGEMGVPVFYNKKFVRIASESSISVTIDFADGTAATASLLVGADGIWSRVRRALYPFISPEYIGHTAVGTTVDKLQVSGLETSHTEMYIGDHGALTMGRHSPDESEYMVGFQKPYLDLGRSSWEAKIAAKQSLLVFLRDGYDGWPPLLQRVLDNAHVEGLFVWPMYVLPKLKTWRSVKSRIVLIADAAHAMPPTAGQGANMAFEDAHTLGMVLAVCLSKEAKQSRSLDEALDFWQALKKERIDVVLEYTMQQNRLRQTAEAKAEMVNGETSEMNSDTDAATEQKRLEGMRWLVGGVGLRDEKIRTWAKET